MDSIPRETPSIHQGLRLMRQCPLCNHEYQGDALSILEQREGTNLVHMTCPACAHSMLAVVMVSPLGMSSVGVLTDLTLEDTRHARTRGAIRQDDVLAFHEWLQGKNALEQQLPTQKQNVSATPYVS